MTEAKKELLALQAEGKYVFHGSGEIIDLFEPRQAYNEKDGEMVEDDKPGIHAAYFVEPAIFMAIFNKQNIKHNSHTSFNWDNDHIKYEATQDTLDQLLDPVGYVYVFPTENFQRRNTIEAISYEPIRPIKRIEVHQVDLPEKIGILTEPEGDIDQ